MDIPQVHTAPSWGPESHAPDPEAELGCPTMRVLCRFLVQGAMHMYALYVCAHVYAYGVSMCTYMYMYCSVEYYLRDEVTRQ